MCHLFISRAFCHRHLHTYFMSGMTFKLTVIFLLKIDHQIYPYFENPYYMKVLMININNQCKNQYENHVYLWMHLEDFRHGKGID